MDWARVIEINHAALTRIVLGLIAMVGLGGSGARLLPEPLYRAVARVLRPAESAVRRLIVIAARGIKVKVAPPRSMPKRLSTARKGSERIAFALFDAPRRYDPMRRRVVYTKLNPRIRIIDFSPISPLFQPRPAPTPLPEPVQQIDAQRLHRRLAAVKLALETLPRQAMRLARWRARQTDKSKSPLRFGRPPGHRSRPKHDIDWVLKECHTLARDVLKEDSS